MSVYETRQIQPKLNRANSDASLSSYRPYQMYQTGQNRFGSQMNLQQSGKLFFRIDKIIYYEIIIYHLRDVLTGIK